MSDQRQDIEEKLRVWPATTGGDGLSSTYVGGMCKEAADEIERLQKNAEHGWIEAGMAQQQRDDLRAELSAYAGQNTNLRNDLVQLGMAKDEDIASLRAQLAEEKAACEAKDIAAKAYYDNYRSAEAQLASARRAIQDYLDGNYPNPRSFRPGKCPHGLFYFNECEECTDDHFTKALAAITSQ